MGRANRVTIGLADGMKRFLLLVTAVLFPLADANAVEPSSDKAAVLAVVQQFFDAMKSRDADGIRQAGARGQAL